MTDPRTKRLRRRDQILNDAGLSTRSCPETLVHALVRGLRPQESAAARKEFLLTLASLNLPARISPAGHVEVLLEDHWRPCDHSRLT